MKICTKCKEEKALDQFSVHQGRKDGFQSWCKPCKKVTDNFYYASNDNRKRTIRDSTKALVLRNKLYVREYLNAHSCVDCGEADPIVLEFDHVRGTKIKEVGLLASSCAGIDRIQQEIDKCEVRCANCHRRATAERAGWYAWSVTALPK